MEDRRRGAFRRRAGSTGVDGSGGRGSAGAEEVRRAVAGRDFRGDSARSVGALGAGGGRVGGQGEGRARKVQRLRPYFSGDSPRRRYCSRGSNLEKTLRDTCQGASRTALGRPPVLLAAGFVVGSSLWAHRPRSGGSRFVPGRLFATGGTAGAPSIPSDASTAGVPPDARPTRPRGGSMDPTVPTPDPAIPPRCMPGAGERATGATTTATARWTTCRATPVTAVAFATASPVGSATARGAAKSACREAFASARTAIAPTGASKSAPPTARASAPVAKGFRRRAAPSIARNENNSPELERCCIDDGYCCLDVHDLDGDGDRRDMVGACEGVRCQ